MRVMQLGFIQLLKLYHQNQQLSGSTAGLHQDFQSSATLIGQSDSRSEQFCRASAYSQYDQQYSSAEPSV